MTKPNVIEKINKKIWVKDLFIAITNLSKLVIVYGLVGVVILTPILKGLWLIAKLWWNLLPF